MADPFGVADSGAAADPFGVTGAAKSDPFGTGGGHAKAPAYHAAASGNDPLRGVKAIAGGAAAKAGSVLAPVMDLLGRPGVATQALISGKGDLSDFARAGNAFVHGVSPEDQQANRDKIKSGLHIKGLVDKLPAGLARGTADAAIDTVIDPTTYLGGLGLVEKGVTAASRGALVGGVKGAEKLAKLRLAHVDKTGDPEKMIAARKTIEDIGEVLGGTQDALTPGGRNVGAAKRALIKAKGFAGLDDHAVARQIEKVGANTHVGLQNELRGMYADATKGLKPADEDAVNAAVDKGTIAKLKPELQPHAHGVNEVFQSLQHLEGARTVRKDLAATGFQLPERLQQFDTGVRGLQKRTQVRNTGYMPHGSTLSPEAQGLLAKGDDIRGANLEEDDLFGGPGPDRTATYRAQLDHKDVNLHARDANSALQDVGRQRQINLDRIDRGARAVAARDTSRELAKTFAPPREIMRTLAGEKADVGDAYRAAIAGVSDEEQSLIKKALSGSKAPLPENLQQRVDSVREAIRGKFSPGEAVGTGRFTHTLADVPAAVKLAFKPGEVPKTGPALTASNAFKGVMNTPKYAMFMLPGRHMLNISSLATLENPVAAVHAAVRFGMSGAPLPEMLRPMWEKHVPGAAGAAKSQAQAIHTAIKAGAVTVNPERDIPELIQKMPGIRDLYRWSGDVLWHFDDAAKATLYDRLIKNAGHSVAAPATQKKISALAAQRVGGSLLDYGDKSELTKKLAYIAPFATYRSKLPGAVLRGVARHPERALLAGRISPAMVGQQVDVGSGESASSALPLADVMEGTADPGKYARSTAGWLTKDVADPAITALHYRGNALNYGKPITWKVLVNQALGGAIGSDQVLTAMGLNQFSPKTFADDLVSGQTGTYLHDQ